MFIRQTRRSDGGGGGRHKHFICSSSSHSSSSSLEFLFFLVSFVVSMHVCAHRISDVIKLRTNTKMNSINCSLCLRLREETQTNTFFFLIESDSSSNEIASSSDRVCALQFMLKILMIQWKYKLNELLNASQKII